MYGNSVDCFCLRFAYTDYDANIWQNDAQESAQEYKLYLGLQNNSFYEK